MYFSVESILENILEKNGSESQSKFSSSTM